MYRYLGKIVSTHGIKGELRLISDFDKKEMVFHPNFEIYIGQNKQKETIASYRRHKNFDMITLKGYNNINEVLKYLKMPVYILRENLSLKKDDYLLEELLDCEIYEGNEKIGKMMEIVYNKANILLKVKQKNGKTFYIPHQKEYIKKVEVKNKKVIVQNIQGLML